MLALHLHIVYLGKCGPAFDSPLAREQRTNKTENHLACPDGQVRATCFLHVVIRIMPSR